MANIMGMQQRSAAPRGRFGRSTSGKRQSARHGLRARSGEPGAKGRFGLGSALGPAVAGRAGMSGSSRRSRAKRGRHRSGMERALSMLGGAMSGGAAKRASMRSAKPAGFALLAGAAGFALKNRDRLMGMMDRGGSSPADAPSAASNGGLSATAMDARPGAPGEAMGSEGRAAGPDAVGDSGGGETRTG